MLNLSCFKAYNIRGKLGEELGGGINFRVHDAQARILAVKNHFQSTSSPVRIDTTDGLSMEIIGRRFNLRPSSTGPLSRLNVETRGSHAQAGKRFSPIKTITKKVV